MNDFGFIITRCVKDLKHNDLWKQCVQCLFTCYPDKNIVIIDDYSTVPVTEEDYKQEYMQNVYVQKSEMLPGCGELLPYLYLHQKRYFKKAIVLHDSVFVHEPFESNTIITTDTVRYIWSFGEHEPYYKTYCRSLLELLGIDGDVYTKKEWQDQGCFGTMCIIDLYFLDEIISMHNLYILVPFVQTRFHCMCLERVFAIVCFVILKSKDKQVPLSIHGSIVEYMPYGTLFEQYKSHKDYYRQAYSIVKTWNSR